MADCYFAGKSYTTRFYCGKHVHADYQWGQEKKGRDLSCIISRKRASAMACPRKVGRKESSGDDGRSCCPKNTMQTHKNEN